MWYVVYLLFAGPPDPEGEPVPCEDCQVLIEADSALHACDRGEAWGREHEKESGMQLLGIEYLHKMDEAPGDGVEVGGMYQEIDDPWGRRDALIPPRDKLLGVQWESDVPIGEWATPEQIARLRRAAGQ